MQLKTVFFFSLVTLGMLLAAGCTNPLSPGETPNTSVTVPPAATTAAPVVLPATGNLTAAVTSPPTTAPVNTTRTLQATDPILHRWIRMLQDADANGRYQGYELKFYADGTIDYRSGSVTEVESNLRIDPVESESTGTWTSRGDNKYLVKVWPVGNSGAQFIREYTLVPEYLDKTYNIPQKEHIESSYELDAVPTYGNQAPNGRFLYPERAKID
jgi:hypothetical protein